MQPNSDKVSMAAKYYFTNRINIMLAYSHERHGANIYDINNQLSRNVGGDLEQGHRNTDANEVEFLDGNLEEKNNLSVSLYYEPFNELYFYVNYKYINLKSYDRNISDNLFGFQIKLNY
jgi:hypothetical protein